MKEYLCTLFDLKSLPSSKVSRPSSYLRQGRERLIIEILTHQLLKWSLFKIYSCQVPKTGRWNTMLRLWRTKGRQIEQQGMREEMLTEILLHINSEIKWENEVTFCKACSNFISKNAMENVNCQKKANNK